MRVYSVRAFRLTLPKKKDCQSEVISKWNEIKNDPDVAIKVDSLIREYKAVTMKNKGSLLQFWAKQKTKTDEKENHDPAGNSF